MLKTLEGPYDFIFMDAAKGQYIHFLPEILRLLARDGVLVSDNVLQDGDVIESRFAVTRRNRTIHKRMREYLYTLTHSEEQMCIRDRQHVFGIVGICPVVLLEDEGFDALAGEVIRYIDEVYPDKHFTFKVNARRARKNYPLESMEINAQMGERILEAFPETSVDVHKPQVMFNIEIRNQINVYSVSYTHLARIW